MGFALENAIMDELPQICKPWNKQEVVERIIAPYLNYPNLKTPEDGVFR